VLRFYSIPAGEDDTDKRRIMLQINDMPGIIQWKKYREGSTEVASGIARIAADRLLFSIITLDNERIVFDSRYMSVLYAQSREEARKAFIYGQGWVNVNHDTMDKIYKIADPLPLEMMEVQQKGVRAVDYNDVRAVRRIPPFSPKWRRILGEDI
jgi:hypothetical protein